MDDNDIDLVTITIPKPRICAKGSFPKISLRKRISKKVIRKPSEASLERYSITGSKPIQVKSIKNDNLIHSYILYAKKQNSVKHKQNLGINLIEKYKIANTDLRRRLHVAVPADDVFAVTDIDDGFYRYLNGRPLPAHIPIFKTLKFIFTKQLRLKYELGCRRDCVLNIEANHRRELQLYEVSLKRYMEQVKLLDKFISEDYKKSIECLKKCEVLNIKVEEKVSELEHLATEKFTMVSRLIGLDYMYGLQQKYGRFLYYLSPPSWRSKNREFAHSVEIEAKGFDFGASSEEDTFNVIFEKMQNECTTGLIKPALFFTQPDDLLNIFDAIEQQQLHHFTYVTHLLPHAMKLKSLIKNLKEKNDAENSHLLHVIKKFKKCLGYADGTESLLKSRFFNILNGLFFDSVGATNVLKLKVHLEFCYEKLYIDKSTNMTIFATAKALEDYFMDYSYKLDEMHSNKIKKATSQYIESEKKNLRRAKTAARELRSFGRLERALLRAHKYIPPEQQTSFVNRRPATRHTPTTYTGKLNYPEEITQNKNQRELTETEMEYLSLFTDWTKDEDPANYLHFTDEDQESKEIVTK